MTRSDYDVLAVTDFRYSGGTTASIAQEVEVQARMGLRTGLIHIDAPHMARGRWSARILGLLAGGFAELVPADRAVRARLMILRHPRVFQHAGWSIAARADHVVLVANQVYRDGANRRPYFDVDAVRRRLRDELGVDPVWAPIGPMMRDSLALAPQPPPMTDADWCNIIDVDAWVRPPQPRVPGPLRIGRHSRDNPKKWPERRADLLAAYPDTPETEVRVLGGANAAARVLGGRPRHWRVYPFDAVAPRAFLHDLDAYVYFHHSGYQEAFGRAVLEALAAGLPVITHPYFERLFGDACRYCEPREVPARLRELGDPPARNSAGIELVRRRYGWDAHARRVAAYLELDDRSLPARPPARRRVLFISSNGGGLGHLTRLLAIARRLPAELEPVFVTLSSGVAAVRSFGYWVDYIPGPTSGALRDNPWGDYVDRRVRAAVRRLAPVAVVFDGTFAYRGLCDALDAFPEVFKVWSRRAMWKPVGPVREARALAHARSFDLVLEPGEYAAEVDDGFTRTQTDATTVLPPVVLLDPGELLPRAQARRELGIDVDAVAVLLNLGAGNINSIDKLAAVVGRVLRDDPAVHLVAARSIIASGKLPVEGERVTAIETYPLGRVMRAFDFAVVAPGYNSFHELLAYGIPTLFVPNDDTALDDQGKRARWGERAGACLVCDADDLAELERALRRLLDPEVRAALARRCGELVAADGAARAAALIAEGCAAHRPGVRAPARARASLARRALSAIRAAVRLRGRVRAAAAAPRTLFIMAPDVLATDEGRADVETVRGLGDRAICLAAPTDLQALQRVGLWVEAITDDQLDEALWPPELGSYAVDKARALMAAYNCQEVRFIGETGLERVRTALALRHRLS